MSTAPVIRQFDAPQAEQQLDEVSPGEGQVTVTYVIGRPPEISDHLELGSLRHPLLRVIEPLRVRFSVEDGSVGAEAEEIDEFGFGPNHAEALTDLQHTLAELYFELEEEQRRLGPDLERVWKILQKKVERRSA